MSMGDGDRFPLGDQLARLPSYLVKKVRLANRLQLYLLACQ